MSRIRSRQAESRDVNTRRLRDGAVVTGKVGNREIRELQQWPGQRRLVLPKDLGPELVGELDQRYASGETVTLTAEVSEAGWVTWDPIPLHRVGFGLGLPVASAAGYYDVHLEVVAQNPMLNVEVRALAVNERRAGCEFATEWRGVLPHVETRPGDTIGVYVDPGGQAVTVTATIGIVEQISPRPRPFIQGALWGQQALLSPEPNGTVHHQFALREDVEVGDALILATAPVSRVYSGGSGYTLECDGGVPLSPQVNLVDGFGASNTRGVHRFWWVPVTSEMVAQGFVAWRSGLSDGTLLQASLGFGRASAALVKGGARLSPTSDSDMSVGGFNPAPIASTVTTPNTRLVMLAHTQDHTRLPSDGSVSVDPAVASTLGPDGVAQAICRAWVPSTDSTEVTHAEGWRSVVAVGWD